MQEYENIKGCKVYWCNDCNIPILINKEQKMCCPLCGGKLRLLTTDVRPVFPQEIKLMELLTGNEGKFMNKSVWKGRTTYYIDGKPFKISNETIRGADVEFLRKKLIRAKPNEMYFNHIIEKFISANREHLKHITDEALQYIVSEAKNFDKKNIMVSFSGGKDSTVTSDLVLRALSGTKIKHIFGNTTLEHELTIKYVNILKKNIDIITAQNMDSDFYSVAKKIGPPSRMSRWCCYMFKTGPVNRIMGKVFGDSRVLTFYGVRKNESVTRSKYNRTEDKAENKKITNQRVCSPIFYWNEFEIWLYILSNKIDFNDAYKLGYSRVGCWCCPNASDISELLARIYLKKKFEKWNKFLIDFAKSVGKENAEEYVKLGGWKSRQGGQGLKEAKSVKLINQNCTVQENGKIYELFKPIDKQLFNLFIPFGKIIDGDKLINEKLVLDIQTLTPIISIQPLTLYKVKIVTMNIKSHYSLHRDISHQIIKFNACKQCLKCEGVCRFNAINIEKGEYKIDENKCKHCKMCVSSKYISGGCLMCRYLRTRRDK